VERFKFYLAAQLGYRHPNDMLDDLTPREWLEWQAAYSSGAITLDGWQQAAVIAATVQNQIERIVAGLSKRRGSFDEPRDYLPQHFAAAKKQTKRNTPKQFQRKMKALFSGTHR